jgi:hypothetical protein
MAWAFLRYSTAFVGQEAAAHGMGVHAQVHGRMGMAGAWP